MSELSRLMLKAVRSLPAEEQDQLLEAMLEPRLAPWPGPGGPGLPAPDVLTGQTSVHRVYGQDPRWEVTLPPLGPETGGSSALKFLLGMVLLIGWVVVLQATRRSIGLAGA